MQEDAEATAIGNAIASISEDFPDVPHGRIVDLVRTEHAWFDGRPIRDYVPVLVERRVRGQLRASLQLVGQ
ncbi:MAG TPA: DUF3562 domain-containing protein [Cellulomonas sp.]